MLLWLRCTFLLLSFFLSFLSFPTFAEKVELVDNINQTPIDAWAGKYLTPYQNKLYFVADGGILGEELYAYDPKTGGTLLIADINIGEGSSDIHDLLVFNNKLYFFAFDGKRYGLYLYDAQNNLKNKLKSFSSVAGVIDYPSNITIYKDELYFTVEIFGGGIIHTSLYSFDSVEGKAIFKFRSGSDLNSNSQLLVVADKLYMILPWDYYGGIYVYDKDTDKTSFLDDVAENNFDEVMGFRAFTSLFTYNEKLYVNFPSKGVARYDPKVNIITNATQNLNDFEITELLTIQDNNLILSLESTELGTELYSYNLVTNEYILVADINIGENDSSPLFVAKHNNKLLFTAENDIYGRELYSYDYENGEVNLAADIVPEVEGSDPNNLVLLDDKLYLTANDVNQKRSIFTISQDFSEYKVIENFSNSDTSSSLPSSFIEYNEQLYFSAYEGKADKNQLYYYDAVEKQVARVSDSDIVEPGVEYQSKLYFANKSGRGLVAYNDDTKTTIVLDNYEQGWLIKPQSLTVANDKLYFISSYKYWDLTENFFYAYDANTNTFQPLLIDYNGMPDYLTGDMSGFIVYQSNLYFYLVNYYSRNKMASVELYEFNTDLSEFNSVFEISYPSTRSEFLTHIANSFFVAEDRLYFTAPNEQAEQQLFTYDANTQQVVQVENVPVSSAAPIIKENKWYFPTTTQNSAALNIYDTQTEQSTIVEVTPYIASTALPYDLTIYNNKLYFKVADNGIISLYDYDFSTQEISLTLDVSTDKPVNHLHHLSKMKVYKNKLYFSGLLKNHGYELFSLHSNHIPEGTIDIIGSAFEHQTITVVSSIEDADGKGEMSYQWYRDNIAIDGETNNSYIITSDDIAKSITVVGSYYDGEGTFEQVTSNPVTPTKASSPQEENQKSSSGGSFGFILFILFFIYTYKQRAILKCLLLRITDLVIKSRLVFKYSSMAHKL
ncbi:hypothetical protein Q4489_02785 [Thalassotalea sp. 1_MG-2023]|uniref:hypothetical protein n=1 Tax=Thalassotalea sp. 1_MG-2023 TaxID=3062680 RepID=UPI0026E38F86|nr:hypothetical protein [Thalassotalea sp. 1_MG-2023]MDO6425917.1 hypothetical protein [Thalassotalea sp. 1_MG-2023]